MNTAPDPNSISLQLTESINRYLTLIPRPDFSTVTDYRNFCRQVCEIWQESVGESKRGPKFAEEWAALNSEIEGSFKTSWGGVHVTKHQHPAVEKYLVVSAGRYLAYEKHEKKVETLLGTDGFGLLVYRPQESKELTTLLLTPGVAITLEPGQEHCILALTDLLVFENSIDPKGMDCDLIFIFEPAA